MQLNGDVLAAYLSTYGGMEEYTLIKSVHGTAYGDYVFTIGEGSTQSLIQLHTGTQR